MAPKELLSKTLKEKRDDSIIVSKRSVEKLYYPEEPQFLSAFVQKFKRRAPLINRGYWLRMQAVEQVVRHFLTEDTGKKKVVVNLGCGYDVLPFQCLHRHAKLCSNTRFVDVDYPQCIQKKVGVLNKQFLLTSLLTGIQQFSTADSAARVDVSQSETRLPKGEGMSDPNENNNGDSREESLTNNRGVGAQKQARRSKKKKGTGKSIQNQVYFRSNEYIAIGCDLHELQMLEKLLAKEVDIHTHSILFVAEVSIAYMDVAEANSVLNWAASFPDSRFCLLEQFLPDGADHPFAHTMLEHFGKQTPLKVLYQYPSLPAQRSRLINEGWAEVDIRSLWALWQDDTFLSPRERHAIDHVEPFDEWEEFALFSGHYFVLLARTTLAGSSPKWMIEIPEFAINESSPTLTPPLEMKFKSQELSMNQGPRSFAAVYAMEPNTIVCHGGTDAVLRHQCCAVYRRQPDPSTQLADQDYPPLDIMCHTVTPLGGDACLLAGGRKSIFSFNSTCWLRKENRWHQVHDLHPGRIRHSAAAIKGIEDGVLIFGGKTSAGEVLGDWQYWTAARGWQTVVVQGPQPTPRFGAAMASFEDGPRGRSGLLLGGMGAQDTVLSDIWAWELLPVGRSNDNASCTSSLTLRCWDRTVETPPLIRPRFGSSLIQTRLGFALIGGIAKGELLRRNEEIVFLDVTAGRIAATPVHPSYDGPRPLFVGCAIATPSSDEILLLGGGAVCFSFGSCYNGHAVSRTCDTGATATPLWHIQSKPDLVNQLTHGPRPTPTALGPVLEGHTEDRRDHRTVTRTTVRTSSDFESLLAAASPSIISSLPLGRCTESWTVEYLKQAVGAERLVVIHASTTPQMSFQSKNFTYITLPFGEFMDRAASGDFVYLRALSSTKPAKKPASFAEDFPTIASDFTLPPVLKPVKDNEHSSVLRISGAVNMWLHYDVMANIYCQVYGKKRVRLYPPADIRKLKMAAGETTSAIDVFDSSNDELLQGTSPKDIVLEPGDVLFIPACWSHATAPVIREDGKYGLSIAVNIFFRNLHQGYAAGRDVYGNRDLEVYQNGRRDVDKIIKAMGPSTAQDTASGIQELAEILLGMRHLDKEDMSTGVREVRRILKSITGLPTDIGRFYLDRLAQELLDRDD